MTTGYEHLTAAELEMQYLTAVTAYQAADAATYRNSALAPERAAAAAVKVAIMQERANRAGATYARYQ